MIVMLLQLHNVTGGLFLEMDVGLAFCNGNLECLTFVIPDMKIRTTDSQ